MNSVKNKTKGNFYSLRGAAEHLEVEGVDKNQVFALYIGDFCSAYYFKLPGCLLSCIDILTL